MTGRKKGTRLLPAGTVIEHTCGHSHTMRRPVHPRRIAEWESIPCTECRAARLDVEGKLTAKDLEKLARLRELGRYWADALRRDEGAEDEEAP